MRFERESVYPDSCALTCVEWQPMWKEKRMKSSSIVFVTVLLAGCSGMGMSDTTPEQRAARNLCEVMRSWEGYRWNQCGEHSGGVPTTYGAR
jgi:hypothetical protein